MARRYAPLKTSFMLTSVIGFFVSAFYIYGISPTWGFSFGLLFFIMFIASFVSMTKASPDEQLMATPKKVHVTVHHRKSKKKKVKRKSMKRKTAKKNKKKKTTKNKRRK